MDEELKNINGMEQDPMINGHSSKVRPKIVPVTNGKSSQSARPAPSSRAEVLACVSAAAINLHVGLILAYTAIMEPELSKPDSDILATKSDISWIASVISLWAPIGSVIGGFAMEWTGRVRALHLAMVPYVLGWIVIAMSQNVTHLIIGRSLCGLSMSMGANAANVYIAEVSRPLLRGSLMSTGSLFISLGMLTIYLQGTFIHDWRLTAWLCLGYGLLPWIAILAFCSNSPVWLVTRGRIDEARRSIRFLLRSDKCAEELSNERLKELISEKQLRERSNDTRSYARKFFDTVRKPQTYKPFWILVVLFTFQQFTGLYIILVFAIRIFIDMDTNLDPYKSTVMVGILRLIMGVVTTYSLRIYGRRKLCIFSGTIMALSMALSGYFIRSGLQQQEDSLLKWIPVICILVFISAGTPGLLTLPWMMSSEMFPHEVRGIIQGPVMAWANFIMFVAIKSFPSMKDLFGGVYMVHWFFAAMSLVSICFVWLFLPETHNRKLIEIEHYFRHNCCYITRNEEAERRIKLNSEAAKVEEGG